MTFEMPYLFSFQNKNLVQAIFIFSLKKMYFVVYDSAATSQSGILQVLCLEQAQWQRYLDILW